MSKSSFEGFPSPKPIKTGTNTGDATATAADIALGLTGYVRGVKVIGTGANAKRIATGSVTSSAGSVTWTLEDNTTTSRPSITVTGLTFKPSLIYYYRSGVVGGSFGVYTETNDGLYTKHVYTVSAANISNPIFLNIKGDISPGSVTNTGFVLPAETLSVSYDWIAYE